MIRKNYSLIKWWPCPPQPGNRAGYLPMTMTVIKIHD